MHEVCCKALSFVEKCSGSSRLSCSQIRYPNVLTLFMIAKIKNSLKKHPIQSILLILLLAYGATFAFTGQCPLQRMSSQGKQDELAVAASSTAGAFNLHEAAMTFELVDDRALNSADFAGKATVVNFWATWCGPCVREIPAFNKIATEMESEVQFVGISLDQDVGAVHGFLKRMPIDYPVAHGDLRLTQLTGPIRSIPTTLFFDSKGNYAGKVVGMVNESQLRKKLKQL